MNVQTDNHRERYDGSSVLITGGLGFIGSNLAITLVDLGAKVTVVDSLVPEYGGNLFNIAGYESKLTINISDVRDPYAFAYLIKGKDFLFNLAGQTSHIDSMNHPQVDLDINCAAQLSILESCRSHNQSIRVLFASTRQIYGIPSYLPVDEQHELAPVDVNGINKLAGEMYHRLYSDVYGLRTTCLRLTNTYGPRMRVKDARQTFLGIWIKEALQGRPLELFGNGSQLRDFNYVDDCVDAMLASGASDSTIGSVYNLGGKEVLSLECLAKEICAIRPGARYSIIPFPPERKRIDIGNYYGNFQKFSQATGWSPKVGVDEGLRMTFKFFEKFGEHYGISTR